MLRLTTRKRTNNCNGFFDYSQSFPLPRLTTCSAKPFDFVSSFELWTHKQRIMLNWIELKLCEKNSGFLRIICFFVSRVVTKSFIPCVYNVRVENSVEVRTNPGWAQCLQIENSRKLTFRKECSWNFVLFLLYYITTSIILIICKFLISSLWTLNRQQSTMIFWDWDSHNTFISLSYSWSSSYIVPAVTFDTVVVVLLCKPTCTLFLLVLVARVYLRRFWSQVLQRQSLTSFSFLRYWYFLDLVNPLNPTNYVKCSDMASKTVCGVRTNFGLCQ